MLRSIIFLLLLPFCCHCLDVVSGSFTIPTAGSQDVGSLGFDPNLVLFYWSENTSDGAADNYAIGRGVLTAGEQLATYGRQEDGGQNADMYHDTASVIALINASGTVTERMSGALGTAGQNKFTITTITGGSAIKVFYIAFNVTAAKLVAFQTPTTTADQAITGAGFTPDAVMYFTTGITTTDVTSFTATGARLGFGFAASASAEVGIGNATLSGSNADKGSQSSSKIIYVPDTSAMLLEGDIKTFDVDGATIQWTSVYALGVASWFLFIDGVQANCGAVNQTNGTGDTAISSIGFTQEIIGLESYCLASASGIQTHGYISLGAATGTSAEGAIASAANSGNNQADHAFDADESVMCYTAGAAGSRTLNAKGNITVFGAGLATLSWTTADATLRQVLWWALGDTAAAPVTRTRNRINIQ